MNNSYLRALRWALRPCRHALLWLAVVLPALTQAQNFTETFGTEDNGIQPFETLTAAASRSAFDNSATLQYSGNVVGAPNNGPSANYANASGQPAVVFGQPNMAGTGIVSPVATTFTLQIGNINTTALGTRQRVSFGLRVPVDGGSGDVVLEYQDANVGGGFQPIPFSFPAAPASASQWTLVSTAVTLPSTTNLILRFRKPAGISNRQYRLDDVSLRAFQPVLTASPSDLIFASTPVNQQSAPRTFTITGDDLTADAVITAPAGYLVRLGTGAYTQSVSVSPNANGNVSATVEAVFAPTFAQVPNPPQQVSGSIVVTSAGATQATVNVTGQATAPNAVLTASPTALSFGNQIVGTSSAPQSFQLTGSDLSANVTVSAPAGFEIRTGGGAFSPNPLVLTPTSGSLSATIDVRFVPGSATAFTGQVTAATAGATNATVAVSGTGTPAPTTPSINATPTSLAFGTVTNSGSAQVQTFTVSATSLSGPLTLTPSNANIQIRNATTGGSFSNSPLVINPNASGNVTNQTIEVTLVPVVSQGPFTGNIALTSPSAATVTVDITANNPSGAISDISLTNPIREEFSTSPGVPSSIKSYNVQADNLLQDLTITAPQFFQISLSSDVASFNALGTTTGNSIVLPRITGNADPNLNGDIQLTTIYVRYFPPGAQTNRGQVIANASAPARTQFVTVNGSSEPEVNVRGTFTPVLNQVKGTQSAPQTLTIVGARLANQLVVRVPQDPEPPTSASPLNPSRTPQFLISLSPNSGFSTQLTITPDANDSIARVPLYVRYAPTRVGTNSADLLFRTPDLALNAEFSRVPNARLQANAIDVEPTRQSTATVTRSTDGRSVTIVFFQDNAAPFPSDPEAAGFGESRLIIASTSNVLTSSGFPQDAVPYSSGNGRYGQGTNLNGNFVVATTGATTVVVTDLDPAVQYFFFAFEYNNDQVLGAENYKTPNLPNLVQPPLPVELVSFAAQLRSGKVNLKWVTASEKNNRGFEVERSQDGRNFSTVLFKAGRGTTNARTTYEAVDNQPLSGLSYYRLKQLDNDGQFSYSPVVSVKNEGIAEATFYPNPTSGQLTVVLPQALISNRIPVIITDLSGRVLREQLLPATGELDLGELKAGTYMITVGSGDQKVVSKVVKN